MNGIPEITLIQIPAIDKGLHAHPTLKSARPDENRGPRARVLRLSMAAEASIEGESSCQRGPMKVIREICEIRGKQKILRVYEY